MSKASSKVKAGIVGVAAAGGLEFAVWCWGLANTFSQQEMPVYMHLFSAALGAGVYNFYRPFFDAEDIAKKHNIILDKQVAAGCADPGTVAAATAGTVGIGQYALFSWIASLPGVATAPIEMVSAFEGFWRGTAPLAVVTSGICAYIAANLAGSLWRNRKSLPLVLGASARYLARGRTEVELLDRIGGDAMGMKLGLLGEAFKQGRYGYAVKAARTHGALPKGFERTVVSRYLSDVGEDPDISGLVKLGVVSQLVGDKESAKRYLKDSAEKGLEGKLIFADYLSGEGEVREANEWYALSAEEIISGERYRLKRMGESTNVVYRVDEEMLDDIFLFKSADDQREIEEEWRYVQESETIIGDSAKLSQLMAKIEGEDLWYGVWRVIKGDTLYDVWRGGKRGWEGSLQEAARISGRLLGGLGPIGHRPDLVSKTARKIGEIFGGGDALQEKVGWFWVPVERAMTDLPWVRRKDNHPENILVGEGRIGLIDFERSADIPLVCESANLLGYGLPLDRVDESAILEEFRSGYESTAGRSVDPSSFLLGHCNGVIQRSIDLAGAWSAPSRSSLWGKRDSLMVNALDKIVWIKEGFPAYYRRYKGQYEAIGELCSSLRRRMAIGDS